MKILIVGGVAAGMSAAARVKRNLKDAEVIVLEQSGDVSWGACGLPYYVGGWFDDPNFMIARTAEQFRELGIEVRIHNRVLSLDHAAKKVRVKNLQTGAEYDESFDQLMIATGGSPILPEHPGIGLGNIMPLTRLDDGEKLKKLLQDPAIKNVAIIGAGFIAIEFAEACAHMGKSVRMIQHSDRVLRKLFDKEVTDVVEKSLVRNGVQLHLSENVVSFIGKDWRVDEVVTDKGRYQAELVIVAIGIKPNTAFLAGSGLEMMPNGAIIVDNTGRTNLDFVFSAGDCATVPLAYDGRAEYVPLATGANKLGRVVGDAMAGKGTRYPGSLSSVCIKVFDIEAGRTGLSERDATKMGISFKSVFITDKNHTNYWPGQEEISIKLIYDPATRKLLGGQIVGGSGSVLRTDVLAAAITGGLTVEQLGMMDLCYAPPFSRTWDALNVAGNVAK